MKHSRTTWTGLVATLLATAFLGGCGGGGSTTPTNTTSAEGSWGGTTTSTNRTVSGIVLHDGTYYIIYTVANDPTTLAGFVQGTSTSNSGNFSSSNEKDFNLEGAGVNVGSISASYTANTSLNGTITSLGGISAPFTSTYDATYANAPTALTTVAGTYAGTVAVPNIGNQSYSLTVSSSGAISSTGNGCAITGTFTPRTVGNAYDTTLTFTGASCAPAGTYTGLGDYSATSHTLLITAPNASRSNAVLFIGAASSTTTNANALVGTVRGPVGAQVTLLNNGADNTSVTVASQASAIYSETSFAFPTVPASGAAYAVSVSSASTNQTCSVYQGATGTMPVTATTVKVGCEYTYDLLTRSTDNSVIAGTTTNNDVVIGGNATTGDGRYVAFISSATGLTAANTNGNRQVFWRDRQTGKTLLVSANASGVEGNSSSISLAISADGQTVAFESSSTNLVTGDINGKDDIFVWSAANPTGGVQRVSVGPAGVEANGVNAHPTLSGDGTVVAFDSTATNLTATTIVSGNTNVIMRNLVSGVNTLVSDSTAGTGVGGNFGSNNPSISEDGKRVAFWSYASNLVAVDSNGKWDIFVYDATSGTNTLVSYTSTGVQQSPGGISSIYLPTISGNGRYVAYSTDAVLVPADTNLTQDVYVVDTQAPTTSVKLASVATGGALANAPSPYGQGARVAMSYDGSWVAFSTSASNLGPTGTGNVVMHNINTGETRIVSDNSSSFVSYVSMSRSAAYVAFGSTLTHYDTRFSSGGMFARYTGAANAWWWQ